MRETAMPIVKTDNAEIYYESHGDGPAIVLAHCAGGNTLAWWQQVAHFAHDYKVVAFDHRGWGRSRCETDYRRAAYFAEDMRAVMDDTGVDRAAIVCNSMGGWTGLRFSLSYPERVSCLTLSCSPAGVRTPGVAKAMTTPPPAPTTDTQVPIPWNEPHLALAGDAFQRIPDRAFLFRQLSSLNPPFEDVGLGCLWVEPEDLIGFSTPTLMLAGAKDHIFPLDVLAEVSRVVPGAELHIIPDAGHSPYFETPEEFNKLVGDFIARHA